MKRILQLLKVLGILFTILIVVLFFLNEKRPLSNPSEEADALAIKMLNALHYEDWKNAQYVQWSFRDQHFYTWDKSNNKVLILWDSNKVLLTTDDLSKSSVYQDGKWTTNQELIQKAWQFFCNDSFWLIAPFKAFDPGTTRSIVPAGENNIGLFVEYSSGGVTPGDGYLWILDEQFIPKSYKMWVSIIPIGGIGATWENWKVTESGAILPQFHTIASSLELSMGDVKCTNSLTVLGLSEDSFIGQINP